MQLRRQGQYGPTNTRATSPSTAICQKNHARARNRKTPTSPQGGSIAPAPSHQADPAISKATTLTQCSPHHHLSSLVQPGLAREVGINKHAQQTQSQVIWIQYNISQAHPNASLSRMPDPLNQRANVFKHLQVNTTTQSPRASGRRGALTSTGQDLHTKGGLLPCLYPFLSVYNILV